MFKGEYKTKTAQGTPITYMIGDSVVYQGKVYTAVNQTQKSPLQSPKDWKYTGLTEPVQGSSSPLLPEENQFWVDQSNNLYIRKDFTNAVWQQISGGSGSGGAGISGPYVISFNGLTGAVTGVTTGTTNTFIERQFFSSGISASGGTFISDIFVNSILVGRGSGNISSNVVVGGSALIANSSGTANLALGQQALQANTTASNNTAVGRRSLNGVTQGSLNTAVGASTLLSFIGNNATVIGALSGTQSTGTGCVYVGANITGTNNSDKEIIIGEGAVGLGSNTAVLGRTTQVSAHIYGILNLPNGLSAAGATLFLNTTIPSGSTLTVAGTITSDSGYRISSSAINTQTGTTYTFLASDNGKIVTFNNGSAITATIPTGLPVGFNCTTIQLGAGQVGFTAASGVTLQSYLNQFKIIGQHGSASLTEYATNIVNISGNLTT